LAYSAYDSIENREKSQYSKLLKVRKDPILSRAPDMPLTKGTGGRLAESQSQFTKYYKELAEKSKTKAANQDIRAALLSHDEETKNNPEYTQIYFK
ncbi:MAG: WD repeat-containing protein 70, variant 2, partial [Marteilia pararefringens]